MLNEADIQRRADELIAAVDEMYAKANQPSGGCQLDAVVESVTDERRSVDALGVESAQKVLDDLFQWVLLEYDIAKRQVEQSRELGNYQQASRHDSYAKAMAKVAARLVVTV